MQFIYAVLSIPFFVSGFCSLLYQVVWLRLAFAAFGVITPVVSVVISVFMLGLGLGAWVGGKYIELLRYKTGRSAITCYGITELVIGIGAFAVPALFTEGGKYLLQSGETNSVGYLLGSAIVIFISILPWSIAMGATFPFVMAFMEELEGKDKRSFSLLYLANVSGAVFGTLLTVDVFIELFGLHKTLWLAAGGNFLIAAVAVIWGVTRSRRLPIAEVQIKESYIDNAGSGLLYGVLFTTGFVSMAMEVIWNRAFPSVLGTQVYSFTQLLVMYLIGTSVGAYWYRRNCASASLKSKGSVLATAAICSILPIVFGDPRMSFVADVMQVPLSQLVLFSILPICAALGYLTPYLIDDLSQGSPAVAGRGYALNILGCITGPLIAGYWLLPTLGVRFSLTLVSLPLLALSVVMLQKPVRIGFTILLFMLLGLCLKCGSWEEGSGMSEKVAVRRDYAGTVFSYGKGQSKQMLVNGVGMTALTPITKYMACLPVVFSKNMPRSVLIICFGMGTTYRSMLTWGIPVTAVELIPSVKNSFSYYYDDAASVLQNKNGKIVIDDGRRFLSRCGEKFDIITIDPPPPLEAAGSSLLYSKNFYQVIKQHLRTGGILEQWFAGGEKEILSAITRSLMMSFRYVKVFNSVEGWGYHFLASEQPIADLTPDEFMARLTPSVKKDLLEWSKSKDPATLKASITNILLHQVDPVTLLDQNSALKITDDRPVNEYFRIRRALLNMSLM